MSFHVNLQSSHASLCGCELTLQTSSVLLQHESSGLDGGAHWDQPSFAPTEGSTMAERVSTSFTLLCRGCPCFRRSRFFCIGKSINTSTCIRSPSTCSSSACVHLILAATFCGRTVPRPDPAEVTTFSGQGMRRTCTCLISPGAFVPLREALNS